MQFKITYSLKHQFINTIHVCRYDTTPIIPRETQIEINRVKTIQATEEELNSIQLNINYIQKLISWTSLPKKLSSRNKSLTTNSKPNSWDYNSTVTKHRTYTLTY